MYILNSTAVCLYWLERLRRECGALSLLGAENAAVQEMAGLYGNVPVPPSYYAELRLTGEAGPDLSAQYPAFLFAPLPPEASSQAQELPLLWPADGPLGRQQELFYRYGAFLQTMPAVLSNSYLYLEADTHSGNRTSSCFLDADELILEKLLDSLQPNDVNEAACLTRAQRDATLQLLSSVTPRLHLSRFGLMLSRQEQPLRLELYADKDTLSELLEAMRPLCAPPAGAAQLLRAIDGLRLFRFMLMVDLLPDGSLGPTVSFELFPPPLPPRPQLAYLQGRAFSRLTALLQEHGLADERIACLPGCCFADRQTVPHCNLFSFLSHLKLLWTNGQPQTAKAYLQLRMETRQQSINQSISDLRAKPFA